MKFSEVFGQTFWYPEMLAGRPIGLTIASIEMEYIDDAQEATAVVYFEDDAKALRLNRRNAATLAEAFGDDVKNSIGRDVLLQAEGAGRWAWIKVVPVVRRKPEKRLARGRASKRKS